MVYPHSAGDSPWVMGEAGVVCKDGWIMTFTNILGGFRVAKKYLICCNWLTTVFSDWFVRGGSWWMNVAYPSDLTHPHTLCIPPSTVHTPT